MVKKSNSSSHDQVTRSVLNMEHSTLQNQVSRCRRHHFLSIFLAVIIFFQNLGSTRAKVVLPVLRSFSRLNGSGLHKGADGMTREHVQQLKDHDFQRSQRHRRSLTAVADFPTFGNEYQVGLYYTELDLGTPTKKYSVQVDTGSDLLWVNCLPCPSCILKSALNVPVNYYDLQETSTGRKVPCSSADCKTLASRTPSSCIHGSCYYWIRHGEGSTTMTGYLVEDVLTFATIVDNYTVTERAVIVFGCGFNQSWTSLLSSDRTVDGVLGFGPQQLSVLSQLAHGNLTTNEFAHCLQGDTGDGGAYGGTILDSGTTNALLVEEAFDAFLKELRDVVTVPYVNRGDIGCFKYSSRDLQRVFPPVTLSFKGGAKMSLKPENYLHKVQLTRSSSLWCLAWSPSSSSESTFTIFGGEGIVLEDDYRSTFLLSWLRFFVVETRGTAQAAKTQQDLCPRTSF